MRLVSVLGMLALLGIAWSMSYHRRSVRLRTVAWGLGLQLLFAVIVLKRDAWSFVGMSLLGLLVVLYLLRRNLARWGGLWLGAVLCSATMVLLGGALVLLLEGALSSLLGLSALLLLVTRRWRLWRPAQPYLAALIILFGVAFLVSRGLHGQVILARFSEQVTAFLGLSDFGARFLFGNQYFHAIPERGWPGFAAQFAFKVLPTIIFFGGFMSVLYYLGVMQRVIEGMSGFVRWTIGTSGAETLSCTANIFVGQTEAPLLIKPFLHDMTRSELLTIMVGGFATIAGGVLAGYIAMGIPAMHLIAASVMSAPAALVVGKIIFPELEHSATAGDVKLPPIDVGGNVVEAATNGITDGLKLAVNVGAMLIGFIALIACVDVVLNFFDGLVDGSLLHGSYIAYGSGGLSPAVGEFRGIFPGSLQTLFGSLLRPLAWLMGVPWAEAAPVGNLLGIKLSLNEFVAYGALGNYLHEGVLSERAAIISTYALCGFANFSSIGIQIGGISALAPMRKAELASVGFRAMLGGALASWLTATVAGALL